MTTTPEVMPLTSTLPTVTHTATTADELISHRLQAPGYREWRAQVQATGGCAAPIHLTGSSQILDRDGAVLHRTRRHRPRPVREPARRGLPRLLRPLRRRRLPPAPRRPRRRRPKGVPDNGGRAPAGVPHPHRALVRARCTPAPSPAADMSSPAGAGTATTPPTPASAPPSTPTPTTTPVRSSGRPTPATLGPVHHRPPPRPRPSRSVSRARDFSDHARLSYAKVAEYQRRGLVHFHAVIRLDGPDGPTDPPPAALTLDALRDAITSAARAAMLTTARPDGTPLVVAWGAQLDLRPVTSTAAAQLEDGQGEITDAALAGYIAKYATKSTGAVDGGEGRRTGPSATASTSPTSTSPRTTDA